MVSGFGTLECHVCVCVRVCVCAEGVHTDDHPSRV